MFHYVYETKNLKNAKCYIGVHSSENLDDDYLGSGTAIQHAIKKYGRENFARTVLQVFDTIDAALIYESELVDVPFVERRDTYNLVVGGGKPPRLSGPSHPLYGVKRPDSAARMKSNNPARLESVREKHANTKMVRMEDGTIRKVPKDSSEGVSINKGKVTVRDTEGNVFHVTKDDPRFSSGEIRHVTAGIVLQCPHCKKVGGHTMKRWHFDNCRNKEDGNANRIDY